MTLSASNTAATAGSSSVITFFHAADEKPAEINGMPRLGNAPWLPGELDRVYCHKTRRACVASTVRRIESPPPHDRLSIGAPCPALFDQSLDFHIWACSVTPMVARMHISCSSISTAVSNKPGSHTFCALQNVGVFWARSIESLNDPTTV